MIPKEIVIAGGGLAGLTLGILLRQRDTPVTIYEAADYPRHRVCGEFINGSGVELLQRIGLLDEIKKDGGRMAHSAALFDQAGRMIPFQLPRPAVCISRYRLDARLVERFQAAGGILKTKSRWKESFVQEGLVRATGRKPPGPPNGTWKWFGLKVHCRNLSMAADLEMHFRRDGYVGLCRLAEEKVNLCGLFRTREAVPGLASEWKKFIAGREATPLHEELRHAIYDEDSFCAIAALNPNGSQKAVPFEFRIGDTLSMIPPITGNGMSIAFESAEVAASPLADYALGISTWQESSRAVERRFSSKFSRRLKYARALHSLLFRTSFQQLFCSNSRFTKMMLRKIFDLTR